MRFFLVDLIEELKRFEYAVGTKCISLADDVFEHHFPGQPAYPGSLQIEAMAQLGGAFLELSLREELDYTPRCVMATVKAKFRDFVKPGDVLSLRAELQSRHEESAMVKVETRCEERLVSQAELLYMFLEVEDPRLQASRDDFLELLTRNTRFID